jgi:hypothetical protein
MGPDEQTVPPLTFWQVCPAGHWGLASEQFTWQSRSTMQLCPAAQAAG